MGGLWGVWVCLSWALDFPFLQEPCPELFADASTKTCAQVSESCKRMLEEVESITKGLQGQVLVDRWMEIDARISWASYGRWLTTKPWIHPCAQEVTCYQKHLGHWPFGSSDSVLGIFHLVYRPAKFLSFDREAHVYKVELIHFNLFHLFNFILFHVEK